MKKALSILMCYAIGMAASALDAVGSVTAYSSINFNAALLWGKTPQYGLGDDGVIGTQGLYYWYYPSISGNQAIIDEYGDKEARYNGFGAKGEPNAQPEYMSAGSDNSGRLAFMCRDMLMRTANTVNTLGEAETIQVTGSGFFVDTLAKFSVREESAEVVPTVDIKNSARFMCWLSAPEGAGTTNLVVTAGKYAADGSLSRANYVITNEVKAGKWYRLTARAIKNAATKPNVDNVAGFALYLDGRPVSCAEETYAIGEDQTAMDELFLGNELYDNRALFPPIHSFGDATPYMTGLAVEGRGWYDELGFVSGNPLAYKAEEIDFVVTLPPASVTNIICKVTAKGEEEPYQVIEKAGEAEISFKVKPSDEVKVEPMADSRYKLNDALTLSGNQQAVAMGATSNYVVKLKSEFAESSRVVARVSIANAYFRVGDEIFDSVSKAVEAAAESGVKLEIENNVTLDAAMPDNGQMRITPKQELVLDLRGHTIRGENFRDEATIYDQGILRVFDSVGGGAIIAPGKAIEVVSTNDALNVNHELATLTIGDEVIRNNFSITGKVSCTQGKLIIKGGTYLTPTGISADTFYLDEYTATKVLGDERCHAERVDERNWRVTYDDRVIVRFEPEVGEAVPSHTNIDLKAERKLVEPAIDGAVGYTLTNWYVKGSEPRINWKFESSEVTEAMTLVAQQSLDRYSISYDGYARQPESYTVKMTKTALPEPEEKAYFVFTGWQDAKSGHTVAAVGEGATFVDEPTKIVTGDLELISQWIPQPISWSNAESGNSESNGTYSGSWAFTIPNDEEKIVKGTRFMLDEIDFCIVNPQLYPKTAEYLVLTNAAGTICSQKREYGYDETTTEYVDNETLENGRAMVCYKFGGVEIGAGEKFGAAFSSTGAGLIPVKGFLRLKLNEDGDDAVFGNCVEAGGEPESMEYLKYCPVYRVKGHLEEVK